jgi:hypothetical protein
MNDPVRDAWAEVGAGFSSLGESISSKFKHTDTTGDAGDAGDAGEADEADRVAGADGAHEDPELRAAFDRFVAAGRELGDRLAGVGRDDEVRTRARDASQKLDDALVATVDLITNRLSGLVGRSGRERTTTDDTPGDDEGVAGRS